MICNSIGKASFKEVDLLARNPEMLELRMDTLNFTLEEVSNLFSSHQNLVATFRTESSNNKRPFSYLLTAIKAGASYLDIELDTPAHYRKQLIEAAKKKGCKIIISYHNYTETPDKKFLMKVAQNCIKKGGDICKIAVTANCHEDNGRLLSLYPFVKNRGDLVAIAMGQYGKITRVVAPFLGAPFTYTFPENFSPTASSQLSDHQMKKIMEIVGWER